MRRSKSNPAKYTKNYRSISQRRMTTYDGLDEKQEIARLKGLLKQGEDAIGSGTSASSPDVPRAGKKRRSPSVASNETEDEKGILSSDLMNEVSEYNYNDQLIVASKKKKTKRAAPVVQLTPQELKYAKQQQKKNERKLKQLEKRSEQKQKRKKLYTILQATALTRDKTDLLASSATLGKPLSKKEHLKKILRKERAGLPLTGKEHALLYRDRSTRSEGEHVKMPPKSNDMESATPTSALSKKAKKQKVVTKEKKETEETKGEEEPSSYAGMLMASLTQLKATSFENSKKLKEEEKTKKAAEPNEESSVTAPYVPREPIVLKTAAALGLTPYETETKNTEKIRTIQRPDDVQAMRYDLPVATMEFEVMDAVRNHDVTIICAETGSGKSTQVPQFLYEGGLSKSIAECTGPETEYLIGVTQPRRVAAVSTAKRVCYEMGQGDGQSILSKKGGGNMVAYHTRYEKAGLGKQTHVKFMTDGILLQEIQSDLLLRKYSVVILDEAHERGLNTDVLIGLLSGSLPLRKQVAAEEGSKLPPLKLVIMSATLKVEDFTGNNALFRGSTCTIVRVPGRTHPVTIHHSKVTELEKYEDVAFEKVCKIHRKLPQGGILLFLTGKQEIVRMVRRLRKAFDHGSFASDVDAFDDVKMTTDEEDFGTLRDLDDEEVDGDLFIANKDDRLHGQADELRKLTPNDVILEDGIPKKATVLPLYSLMTPDDQAKIFAPVPEGHRLIVVATNIAETSITIPDVSYVVDSGRQKCRNYNAQTGMASYDIMWISKAAADQRAGRSGRCGPGHCYRLYSSSLYSRHMESFGLPEVLTRPLEDVVLTMKTMQISNVNNFPFPTPPDRSQIDAAVSLLANIGCIDISQCERYGGDGKATALGIAVSKLPLGVRYGKMLLVAAQSGVLDYAIPIVAALSEASPFVHSGQVNTLKKEKGNQEHSDNSISEETTRKRRWEHKGGDILAALVAVGAHDYATRMAVAGDKSTGHQFCEENSLNAVVMDRIQKMRGHIGQLVRSKLSSDSWTCEPSKIIPPNKVQEKLLRHVIASGLLDKIAILAPLGSINGEHPFSLRSAYLSCSSRLKGPLFMDRNSVLFKPDARQLPQWVCFDSLERKTHKDGTPIAVMKNVTPIDPAWLGSLAEGSNLLAIGEPTSFPPPIYDRQRDAIMCSATTKFGDLGWEVAPVRVELLGALKNAGKSSTLHFQSDDSFRWFGRFLLEGKVLPELVALQDMLIESPASMTRRKQPSSRVTLFASALAKEGVDTIHGLEKCWDKNPKFLLQEVTAWVKKDRLGEAKKVWVSVVMKQVALLQDNA